LGAFVQSIHFDQHHHRLARALQGQNFAVAFQTEPGRRAQPELPGFLREFDFALNPMAGQRPEIAHFRQVDRNIRCKVFPNACSCVFSSAFTNTRRNMRRNHRPRQRMLGILLQRCRQTQRLITVSATGQQIGHLWLAASQRAGLVERQNADFLGPFQRLGIAH
jgi:hypothetical protein